MKVISPVNKYILLFNNYSLPILVIGIISRTFIITSNLYFIVPAILLINIFIFLLLTTKQSKDYFYFLIIILFPVYCAFTTLWSLTPEISIQRALYLLLMYFGVYATVYIYRHFSNNRLSLIYLLPANIIIVILSVFSLISGLPGNSWTGGNSSGFMGFAGHQNTLAAAILITLPGVIAICLENIAKGKSSGIFRVSSFVLLLTVNIFILFITYSRAAILTLAIGFIAYLILIKSKKYLSFLFIILILIIVSYFTIPFSQNSIENVLNKKNEKLLNRRIVLWQPSLEAAKIGGLFGLGYGVSAPDIKTPKKTGSHFEDGVYVREKGNSILALIEETGFAGLFIFLLPVILLIRKFKIGLDNSSFLILNSSLAAMFVHAQFEAWWVGVGSISLPLFLIFLFMVLFQEN